MKGDCHLPMTLDHSDELKALLSRHGDAVALSAAGLFPALYRPEPEPQEFILQVERQPAPGPGAVSCGQYILAVVRGP